MRPLLSYERGGYGALGFPGRELLGQGWSGTRAVGLLDALGIEKALVHGTSMGGMVAVAFSAKYPERRSPPRELRDSSLRRLPANDVPQLACARRDPAARRAVGPGHDPGCLGRLHRGQSGHLRERPFGDRRAPPYTVRQACLAMEQMDLGALVSTIRRPILFTNGTTRRDDTAPPPRLPGSASPRSSTRCLSGAPLLVPDDRSRRSARGAEEAVEIVGGFFGEVLASGR